LDKHATNKRCEHHLDRYLQLPKGWAHVLGSLLKEYQACWLLRRLMDSVSDMAVSIFTVLARFSSLFDLVMEV
jgi:hypothetical protein